MNRWKLATFVLGAVILTALLVVPIFSVQIKVQLPPAVSRSQH